MGIKKKRIKWALRKARRSQANPALGTENSVVIEQLKEAQAVEKTETPIVTEEVLEAPEVIEEAIETKSAAPVKRKAPRKKTAPRRKKPKSSK